MLSKAKLQQYTALLRKKERQKSGLFLAEGSRLVQSAIAAETEIVAVIVSEDNSGITIPTAIPFYQIDSKSFKQLSDTQASQGIIAVCKIPQEPSFKAMKRILFLDGVQDPGNMGTLIRTAAWFGLEAVIANESVDFFNPKVIRATMGGIWDIPCVVADIHALKLAGFTLYGADMSGISLAKWQPAKKAALVLGNEGNGLSEEARQLLDEQVYINGNPKKATESLNVAVAGGILMQRFVL